MIWAEQIRLVHEHETTKLLRPIAVWCYYRKYSLYGTMDTVPVRARQAWWSRGEAIRVGDSEHAHLLCRTEFDVLRGKNRNKYI